jgi:hypothetical protein
MQLESYIDYSLLSGLQDTARSCFNNQIDNWLEIKNNLCNLRDAEDVDLYYVNLYPEHDAVTDPILKAKFQPIVDYINTMRNVLDVVMIVNGPNSVIPEHTHPEDLLRGRIYRILLGIFVPEDNVSIINDNKVIKSLNMYVIDGVKPHSGYNRSDKVWVQIILSVNQ